MNTQGHIRRPPRAAYAEAAAWLAQLHGSNRSDDLEADFRAWLKADPEHARAFERVTDVWDAAGDVNIHGLPRITPHDAFATRRPRWRPVLAALVLGAVGLGAFLLLPRAPDYATGIGEQRIVRLSDGTRLSMNADSAVEVNYGRRERTVRLAHGEALFEVVRDPQRPFVVVAGERKVIALGTSFVVRSEPGRLDVTLLEGKVRVASAQAPGVAREPQGGAITLLPGQRLRVRADRSETLDTQRAETATAWRRGEVILDDTPLDEAMAEMNRYDQRPLALDDPTLGRLPVSGIYRIGNNRDFAQAVAAVYGLQVREEADRIRLTRD
ncbi:FecR family protein [Luteimonas salinilitoris]|uniref:FecR domain-containing protein n=1 Tax=Luteimonas salinilitoris TaxID=3237697 RepID=A0ABV4HW46_9GAMM